ncbi:hypothetical protein Golomagni_00892 [Golovinomyces magnicellulatus]|nr:hypothetical protein Golomagni_00892 [Golovinomyces magnicellulatus]
MVSQAPTPSDRPLNSRLKTTNEKTWAEKTPGLLKNDVAAWKERTAQDLGLKDYHLGECLGKGAFGSVYKAFNWRTGEAVAVKQIRLGDLPKSELRMIEAEIDLLKNLNHDNIVKYLGFVKSSDRLNIILEYCENGSLHSICKNYGKFPENLVGVYMGQILLGLQYLHDQGVIHRDIKGANILTTKDGKVKLADFGVSTSTLAGADKEAQVVGTPYWMAPEIIQLSGATTASDIWSLGCTVIELLEGKPPYYKLAPMPALFAIVNDDHPPLPEGVSPAARDFLIQCFQKDPNLRVSARKLLKHAWIVGSKRIDAPVTKTLANFSEAVEEVKQWNEALKSPTGTGSCKVPNRSTNPSAVPIRRYIPPLRNIQNEQRVLGIIPPAKGLLELAKTKHNYDAFRSPESKADDNWDDDFASSISPSAMCLPQFKPQDNFEGKLSTDRLKAFASFELASNENDNWDHNFEGNLVNLKSPQRYESPESHELETIRPYQVQPTTASQTKSTTVYKNSANVPFSDDGSRRHIPSPQKDSKLIFLTKTSNIFGDNSMDDYAKSSIENDYYLNKRKNTNKIFSSLTKTTQDEVLSPKLFHPSDLISTPRSAHSSFNSTTSNNNKKDLLPGQEEQKQMHRARSAVQIKKFAEDEDDEDFSDIFANDSLVIENHEGGGESKDRGKTLMLYSKLSNNSWLGDEDDEDDPFASLEQGFDEMDLQANIVRDKHARLCTLVEGLVGSLKVTVEQELISDVSAQLLDVLYESEDAKALIISAHGMLPILEILEPCTVKSRQSMILHLLKVVNTIILDNVEIQENLCFVGGIPIITKFAARQYSNEIRLEAAAFVRQMYQTSTLTLQMFVSAGGLNVLVEFLDEDYDESRDLLLIGVNGIWNVFELQGPTPKNDFCRIFSRSKILSPLALVLDRVLHEDDDLSELVQGRIVNIFYLFSQAENYVKEVVADRVVIKRVLKDLSRMRPVHQITMLKFIKNLSMLSTTLDSLHAANAIELLIDLLSSSMKNNHVQFREISNQVLNTMYNLCRLSKVRQEDAAINGIVPLLQNIMKTTDRPPKEFALPILCDLAHSGKVGRKYLWQNKGLEFYISLLEDQYWQVTALDAIFIWYFCIARFIMLLSLHLYRLQEETARVEKYLLKGNFTQAIVDCFSPRRANAFDYNLLEPLQKLLRLSSPLAASLARPDLYSGMIQKLNHKKAVVRLNLLRIVRSISDPSDELSVGITDHNLFEAIKRLAESDTAVLVRNMAGELVRAKLEKISENENSRSRPGQIRRTFTPPSLLHGISTPITPSHTNCLQHSSAFMEGSITPRRVHACDKVESSIRPQSREDRQIKVSQSSNTDLLTSGSLSKSRFPRTSMGLWNVRQPNKM